MSNPHRFSNLHHGFDSDSSNGRDERIESRWNVTNRMQSTAAIKRARDDVSDVSWQNSFKRLKVMEADSCNELSSNAIGNRSSLYVDGGCVDVAPNQNDFYPEHQIFFPRHRQLHQDGHLHDGSSDVQDNQSQFPREQSRLTVCHRHAQAPGECSLEDRPANYQVMNSLLGSLHWTRRRQQSGTGQPANPLIPCLEDRGSAHLDGFRQLPSLHLPQHHSSIHRNHHLGSGGVTPYLRPAKKKNISLRVNSNLF